MTSSRKQSSRPTIAILGIRGIPASHGGFETFAERLALHLTGIGWHVIVYCHTPGLRRMKEDEWQGITRVMLPASDTPIGTIRFDWSSITDVLRRNVHVTLTLGYNTAMFGARLRAAGVTNLINMDGIEWGRAKWGPGAKAWFWVNDWLGCWLGDHLIADNPEITKHLRTRTSADKITMIPYGADRLESAPVSPLAELGIRAGRYVTVIARPEPENSVLEIVKAFSAVRREVKLVVLGRFDVRGNRYHAQVQDAAGPDVLFPGAIYDAKIVQSLRANALFHIHGHTVGGTNPSLVEAMGAGNAILAHDNPFNRWVAQKSAVYFRGADDCRNRIDQLLANPDLIAVLSAYAIDRHEQAFEWRSTLSLYEALLREHLPVARRVEERMARTLAFGPDLIQHTETVGG